MATIKVPIEISARHVHLSEKDLERLFGEGYELTATKALSQRGQFAARETVTLGTPKDMIINVRLVGPVRKQSQVEISITDALKLGLNPPLRVSGGAEDSPGITLIDPEGQRLDLNEGVIIAQRHIHASPEDAKEHKLKDGDRVSVKVGGERGLTFDNVAVRVDPTFVWSFHIDTDEANAAGVGKEQMFGKIIK
jgi:putative phosphotransacetylase